MTGMLVVFVLCAVGLLALVGTVMENSVKMNEVKSILRQKEDRLRVFNALQECPRCGEFTFAFIEDTDVRTLLRKCGDCEHVWSQVK